MNSLNINPNLVTNIGNVYLPETPRRFVYDIPNQNFGLSKLTYRLNLTG